MFGISATRCFLFRAAGSHFLNPSVPKSLHPFFAHKISPFSLSADSRLDAARYSFSPSSSPNQKKEQSGFQRLFNPVQGGTFSPVFHFKSMGPSTSIRPSVRFAHSDSKEDAKSESKHEEAKKTDSQETYASGILKTIIGGLAGGTAVGAILAFLQYVYSHPLDPKWIEIGKEIGKEIREFIRSGKHSKLDESLKDLKLAKDLLEAMKALNNLMNTKDFEQLMAELEKAAKDLQEEKINKLKEDHEKKLGTLQSQKEHLEKEASQDKKTIEELNADIAKMTHIALTNASEKQGLIDKCKNESDQLKNDHQKVISQLNENTQKIEQQNQKYKEELAQLRHDNENGKNEAGRFKEILKLIDKTAQGDPIWSQEFLKYLSGGDKEIKFDRNTTFPPNYLSVVKNALAMSIPGSASQINLSETHIEYNDALKLFMEGLKDNRTVVTLNLGDTYVGRNRQDVVEISNMLKRNRTIKELHLQKTYLRDEHVLTLECALEPNQLELLDLRNSYVNEPAKERLRQKIKTVL